MERRARTATFSSLIIVAMLVLFALAATHPIAATGQAAPPAKVAGLSDLVQFTSAEIQALEAGQAVSKLLAPHSNLEVAVAGAVWINAPVNEGVRAMKDIEHLERGNGFQVTKPISNPPRLEDFSALGLPEDVKDLRSFADGREGELERAGRRHASGQIVAGGKESLTKTLRDVN